MKKNLKVYLAGCIYLVEYRAHVKENYSKYFTIVDPLEYEEWEVQDKGKHNQIINTDKRLLNCCDILIADVSFGPTFGTTSEIALMKHLYFKPVFTFNIPEKYKNDPWLIGQSTKTFNDVDECFNYLKLEYID